MPTSPVPESGSALSARATFDALYARHHRAMLAFTMRRTASPADAEDAAAEAFVIAWRKLDSMPAEPLPWLYAIARRVLANQHRGSDRLTRLRDRLRALPASSEAPPEQHLELDGSRGPALAALAALRPADQELLRLVAWEELGQAEIAVVLGISVNAVAIRLHRARSRFAAALEIEKVKESAPSRTSSPVKGRLFGRIRREQVK